MKNIAIIGISCCGKTEGGALLAEKLNMNFVDIDIKIEEEIKMPIKEIFSKYGEPYFRNLEKETIEKVALCKDTVISTGGGAVLNDESMQALKNTSTVIFIERDIAQIINTVQDTSTRPLLKDGAQALYDLYKTREHLYRKYADVTVLNNGTLDELVDKIIDCI